MKRWVVRICLFLLLGAIVNVAVAWLIEYRHRGALAAPMSAQDARSALPIDPEREAAQFISVTGTAVSTRGRASYKLLAFHREVTADGNMRYADQFMVWHAGWPCHSMHGWTAFGRAPLKTGAHGLWRLRRNSLKGTMSFFLPLIPLWPGFAINTLLYAAILWGGCLLFAAPFALRRRLRIKRGLCPKCAYPVGSNERCTECGVPHAVRPTPKPRRSRWRRSCRNCRT